MKKRNFLWLYLVFLPTPCYCIDTNEPLETGVTNFEAYYTWTVPNSHSAQGILGMGASELINLYVSPTISTNQQFQLSVQNIATVARGAIDFDVLAGAQTDFDLFQVPIGVEVTYPLGSITSYVQPILTLTLSPVSFGSFLPVGFFVSPEKNMEVFFQLDYSTGSWTGFGGAVGANLNVGAIELISELGVRPNFYCVFGFIFTLES